LRFSSFLSTFVAGLFVLGFTSLALADASSDQLKGWLPKEIGAFRQVGAIRPSESLNQPGLVQRRVPGNSDPAGVEAEYISADGERLLVEVARLPQDSDAYSVLTITAKDLQGAGFGDRSIGKDVGTASFVLPGRVAFFKGRTFVSVSTPEGPGRESSRPMELARLIADRLELGEGDIPVLVKHLPQWEQAQRRAIYNAGFRSLNGIVANQPVLNAVTSEGDADAVASNYDNAQLLLIEFNTPQLAADNDRQISAKIQELLSQGQPVPSAYRRVGNYSVFVFNAPNEQVANALVDQVKYEQVVQWLGDNPHLLEKATREYYETTAGVLVAVVKASGLSLLACFAIGGFFGALLFTRRRAQQRESEAFSDAGGMLRLNIDEMTAETDPSKLLGRG
jgi:hypothetical protein